MVRIVTDKPQITSRERQEHLATDDVVVHRSTKAFPECSSQEELHEACKVTHGQATSILEKNTGVRRD